MKILVFLAKINFTHVSQKVFILSNEAGTISFKVLLHIVLWILLYTEK